MLQSIWQNKKYMFLTSMFLFFLSDWSIWFCFWSNYLLNNFKLFDSFLRKDCILHPSLKTIIIRISLHFSNSINFIFSRWINQFFLLSIFSLIFLETSLLINSVSLVFRAEAIESLNHFPSCFQVFVSWVSLDAVNAGYRE